MQRSICPVTFRRFLSGNRIIDTLFGANLLVSGDASVDGGVDDPIQRHAQQVDVSMQLLVLVLANQSPQLLVLVLHHRDGVFQWTHLHLSDRPASGRSQNTQGSECTEV